MRRAPWKVYSIGEKSPVAYCSDPIVAAMVLDGFGGGKLKFGGWTLFNSQARPDTKTFYAGQVGDSYDAFSDAMYTRLRQREAEAYAKLRGEVTAKVTA